MYKINAVASYGRFPIPIIIGLFCSFLAHRIYISFEISGIVWILILAIATFITFLAVLYLLREIDNKDINFFVDLMNVKKMRQYLNSELKI